MNLIVAGGRNQKLSANDRHTLYNVIELEGVLELVSGGCSGVDKDGEELAKLLGIKVKVFCANWKDFGNAAGPMRNKEMAKYADALALFPGGKGTRSMKREETATKQSKQIKRYWVCH